MGLLWCDMLVLVAPLVGAWIEIYHSGYFFLASARVAPLVGAWIEIGEIHARIYPLDVAPLVGAWIEIFVT